MKLKINEILLVAGMAGAAFWLAYFAPVDYSGFDPLGNLVTAQAILQRGTIKLDADRDRLPGYVNGWHLREKGGHLYYHYPLGTPLTALPFVWAANRAGWDMTRPRCRSRAAPARWSSMRSRWCPSVARRCS